MHHLKWQGIAYPLHQPVPAFFEFNSGPNQLRFLDLRRLLKVSIKV